MGKGAATTWIGLVALSAIFMFFPHTILKVRANIHPKDGSAYQVTSAVPASNPNCWTVELRPWPDGKGNAIPMVCGVDQPKPGTLVHWDQGRVTAFTFEGKPSESR
jgi:hypothetical protein